MNNKYLLKFTTQDTLKRQLTTSIQRIEKRLSLLIERKQSFSLFKLNIIYKVSYHNVIYRNL